MPGDEGEGRSGVLPQEGTKGRHTTADLGTPKGARSRWWDARCRMRSEVAGGMQEPRKERTRDRKK